MIKRIVEISSAAYIHTRLGQLIVERNDQDVVQVPLEDLGTLILDNPAIRLTQAMLTACAEQDVVVVISDSKHLPASVFLPSDGNTLQGKFVAAQAALTLPTQKRLWQDIIRRKIAGQADVLANAGVSDVAVRSMVPRVRSGDPDNIEAQAARAYWPLLFGPGFRRNVGQPGINALLNYGYAVIRAACARAICGAGLHPSLGIHHHNQYDPFCLADDLVEPLRPIIDAEVHDIAGKAGEAVVDITRGNRERLLTLLTRPVTVGEQSLPLLSSLHVYVASIRAEIVGERGALVIPAP